MQKFMSILIILIVLLFSLAGCGVKPPSQEELAHADYGPYPQNYQEIVKSGFMLVLKDPLSAQYRFNGAPTKGWYRESILSGGDLHFGWWGHVLMNAKNGFGGYNGFSDYTYLINRGQLRVLEPTNPNMQ